MKYSDAQKEATARYNKKAYDRINVIVKRGNDKSSRISPPAKAKASTALSAMPLSIKCNSTPRAKRTNRAFLLRKDCTVFCSTSAS